MLKRDTNHRPNGKVIMKKDGLRVRQKRILVSLAVLLLLSAPAVAQKPILKPSPPIPASKPSAPLAPTTPTTPTAGFGYQPTLSGDRVLNALNCFASVQTFQFRYTEERLPRFAPQPAFRSMTAEGEAMREGTGLRLRFTVTMQGGGDERAGEWYAGWTANDQGFKILHRPNAQSPWKQAKGNLLWIADLETRLLLTHLRQPIVFTPSARNALGCEIETYRGTMTKPRESVEVGLQAFSGTIASVTTTSIPPTLSMPEDLPYEYRIFVQHWGQGGATSLAGPYPTVTP